MSVYCDLDFLFHFSSTMPFFCINDLVAIPQVDEAGLSPSATENAEVWSSMALICQPFW